MNRQQVPMVIPDGYTAIDFRSPKEGDYFLEYYDDPTCVNGEVTRCEHDSDYVFFYPILKKNEPEHSDFRLEPLITNTVYPSIKEGAIFTCMIGRRYVYDSINYRMIGYADSQNWVPGEFVFLTPTYQHQDRSFRYHKYVILVKEELIK